MIRLFANFPHRLVTSGSASLVNRGADNRCALDSGSSVVVTRLASNRGDVLSVTRGVEVLQLLGSGGIVNIVLRTTKVRVISVSFHRRV